jgi:hypothetical protein
MFSVQLTFALDVPLKVSKTSASLKKGSKQQQKSVNEALVWASVYDNAMILNFSQSVGIARITILNEKGAVVYQQGVDTSVIPGAYIQTHKWRTGKYTLTTTYGSIKLQGEFELS